MRAVCRALAAAGLGLLLCLAVMTLLDGLLRSFANQPIDAVRDLGGVVAAVAMAACFPIAMLERSNISIRFLEPAFGRATSRNADRFAALLVLVVLGAIAREFFRYAGAAARSGDATWILNIPTAPFWYAVDALLWVAVLAQALVAARIWRGGGAPIGGAHP